MEGMNETVQTVIDEVVTGVATYGLDVVGAVLILLVGWWFAGWSKRMLHKQLTKSPKIDRMLASFFSSFVKYLIVIFTVIAVLSQFGVQTASLITVLGAAGLAIGLALQGTLSNVAAGVMLLIFRPFRVGDFVEVNDISGTVKDTTLFLTELTTPDNIQITVPNSEIWGNAISNFSFNPTRRINIPIGISYGSNIEAAFAAIRDTIAQDDRVLADPAPNMFVSELADSSVNLAVRVWSTTDDFWPLQWDLTKAIKERLDAEGIEIPFPQRVMHMAKEAAE